MTLAHFNIDDVVRVLNPIQSVIKNRSNSNLKFNTDTRSLGANEWFIALNGNNFNGHDYIKNAINAGCQGVIIDDIKYLNSQSQNIILVDNTLNAYHKLANLWLKKVNPTIIAITGSSGKTTTKEICAQVLERISNFTHKSANNENNEFGVPKTIFNMSQDCRYLVVELAMRGLGQIEYLANTVDPNYGIITNAGVAHIELLGSKENIIRAKCELLVKMNSSSLSKLAIIGENNDSLTNYAKSVYNKKLKIFNDTSIKITDTTTYFTSFVSDDITYEMPNYGMAVLQDAWCVIQVLKDIGIDAQLIKKYLKEYTPIQGRGNKITNKSGSLIIDESYNANPDSVKAAIASIQNKLAYSQTKKIVVLGQMAELGDASDKLHEAIGAYINDTDITHLITIGQEAKKINDKAKLLENNNFSTWQKACEYIKNIGLDENTLILIKGSRVAQLDNLVKELALI